MTFIQEQVERLCRNDNHISGNSGDSNKYAIKESSIVRLINQSIAEGKRMEREQRISDMHNFTIPAVKRIEFEGIKRRITDALDGYEKDVLTPHPLIRKRIRVSNMTQSLEQLKKNPVYVSKWMRDYGVDDNDVFNAGDVEIILNDFKDHLIEQVYHARTEEVVEIVEGMKRDASAPIMLPITVHSDMSEFEKIKNIGYNQALTDLIAILTKISND